MTTTADAGLFTGDIFRPRSRWTALADGSDECREMATVLFHEAELLDTWQLDDWLAMFADQCVYWVPITFGAARPDTQVNLIFDNHSLLEDRVFRLQTGKVPSQDPPSRVLRSLTNLVTAEVGTEGDRLVQSTFSVWEHRPRSTRSYVGRYIHRLRRTAESWQIVGKKVSLLTSDEPLPSLTFLL